MGTGQCVVRRPGLLRHHVVWIRLPLPLALPDPSLPTCKVALGAPVSEGLSGWAPQGAPPPALVARVLAAKAAAMPHFLDWFVPVYLVISVLILVGFGACIYYFEPGLQEAHKWRMQRPLVDRDLRKTLMVRDNLAFGGPEV
ncbi:Hypothetical predicted protein [Marmota monax]|uniref:Uncharacterized protein n=1 Tax=Marmota monax TaxID=9995 RepID=A0A5E4AK09_MARMO|nr:hypothetical protein GHT09_019800 [Marmota monax]VTJ57310.1 Hypothetical predicted protein [Marmota monax]